MDTDFAPEVQAKVQVACAVFILLFLVVAAWGVMHPAPWSPLGKAERGQGFDTPDNYGQRYSDPNEEAA